MKRTRVRQIRRTIVMVTAAAAAALILAGRSVFPSMAEEDSSRVLYYRSIQIGEGDSLWAIAARWRSGSDLTTGEYVEELRRINSLREDTIHAGQYLTVIYYK